MQNYVQPGHTLTLTAAANVVGGQVVEVGSIIGVAAGAAAAGQPMDVHTEGVYTLPKVSALAINVGDEVYWDNTADLVTETSAGNTKLGVAVTAAANPSASVNVRLNGTF